VHPLRGGKGSRSPVLPRGPKPLPVADGPEVEDSEAEREDSPTQQDLKQDRADARRLLQGPDGRLTPGGVVCSDQGFGLKKQHYVVAHPGGG
jgi:hypothetical protein